MRQTVMQSVHALDDRFSRAACGVTVHADKQPLVLLSTG
jgi:hypothetical protein